MPRYNVEYRGYWAAFSSVSDGFVTHLMEREKYEKWREVEYGRHCGPIEDANIMTWQEAISAALLNRSILDVFTELVATGFRESDILDATIQNVKDFLRDCFAEGGKIGRVSEWID